jgi:uncharacterized protein
MLMPNVINDAGMSGCFRCFFVWRPRKENPERCPRCKSRLWDVPRLEKVRRGGGLGIAEIISPHREKVLTAIRANRGSNPRVFGSVARSTATRRSDVDFLVDFEEDASAFDRIGLAQDLETILGRRADVMSVDGLHWIVRAQVLFEATPLR